MDVTEQTERREKASRRRAYGLECVMEEIQKVAAKYSHMPGWTPAGAQHLAAATILILELQELRMFLADRE